MKPELQWECWLPRGELPESQLTVRTGSLDLGNFGLEFIAKNKLLTEELSELKATAAHEQAEWKFMEE